MKRLLLLVSTVAVLAASGVVSADEIRVDGGGAAISTVFMPLQEAFEQATGIKLILSKSTPASGLISVVHGLADVATGAHPLNETVKAAKKSGAKFDEKKLQTMVIAKNKTVIYLHKTNLLKSLSKTQLKEIYTGKITNWKSVGGDNQEIIVVWGKATPGQNELFTRLILDGADYTKSVKLAGDYAAIRDMVVNTPGAIGLGPQGLVTNDLNVPRTPPVVSDIIMITKGEPSAKVRKLAKFIKEHFALKNS